MEFNRLEGVRIPQGLDLEDLNDRELFTALSDKQYRKDGYYEGFWKKRLHMKLPEDFNWIKNNITGKWRNFYLSRALYLDKSNYDVGRALMLAKQDGNSDLVNYFLYKQRNAL